MSFNFAGWIGQVTTGHGAMILGPTLLAASSGQMTWLQATPLLLAGMVGLLWPENTALKTASQNAVTDVETLVTAYRAGLNHGGAVAAPAPVAVVAAEGGAPAPKPVAAAVTAALALLVVCGLFLSACASGGGLTAQGQADVVLGCQLDQEFQPITAATLATLVPATSAAVSLDNLLVHPAVVAYCSRLGGTPAPVPAAVAAPAPAPTTVTVSPIIVPVAPVAPAAVP